MKKKKTKSELCLECLECCKIVAIPYGGPPFMHFLSPLNKKFMEFYGARNCTPLNTPEYGQFIVVPYPCPQLTPKGCKIYKTRPEVCREYDGLKSPITTYVCKWKELEDG